MQCQPRLRHPFPHFLQSLAGLGLSAAQNDSRAQGDSPPDLLYIKCWQLSFDVGIHHPWVSCSEQLLHTVHGLPGTASRSKAITVLMEAVLLPAQQYTLA
jgi:hypothetical protein